jgi:hypothetical protein
LGGVTKRRGDGDSLEVKALHDRSAGPVGERYPFGLLPHPPVVSSVGAAWEGIAVEHNRQPPFETPEHALLWHLVTVQLGEPVRAETVAEGRLRRCGRRC